MILAAADYAEGKEVQPPPELLDWLRSEQFNALPHAGGWKDQPHRYISRSVIYSNVYNAIKAYRGAMKDGKAFKGWLKNNKDKMDIINSIKDLRNGVNR